MEFKYRNMTFIYHPKTDVNGWYFTHKLSGDGFYNKQLAKMFGRPSKNRAIEVCANYVESLPRRIEVIDTYFNEYKG